jgi:O-antigen ligase
MAMLGVKGADNIIVQNADGSLLWVWMAVMAASQFLFNRTLRLRWHLVCIGIVAATLVVGWANREWASGWVPVMAALWVLIWLKDWKLGFAVTLVGGVVLVFMQAGLVQSLIAGDQYSITTRYAAAQVILENIAKVSPVFGLGPSNYYHYTPLYPILGYYVQFNSHNQYIDIIAQYGLVGMAAFLWLMAAIVVTGLKLRRKVSGDFRAAYVNACVAGLVGSLVAGGLGDWFIPFVYNIGITGFRASMFGWLFPGGLVAIEQMLASEKKAPAPAGKE